MKHFSEILISDCHVLHCWEEFSRQVQISCLHLSYWFHVTDAGKDDLLGFHWQLGIGDIVVDNFVPTIHGIGCTMAHTSRPQAIFRQEWLITVYMPFKYFYRNRGHSERLSEESDLILSACSGHQSSYESAAQDLCMSSGLPKAPKFQREREPAALSQGSGLWFNSTPCCVAKNMSL